MLSAFSFGADLGLARNPDGFTKAPELHELMVRRMKAHAVDANPKAVEELQARHLDMRQGRNKMPTLGGTQTPTFQMTRSHKGVVFTPIQ